MHLRVDDAGQHMESPQIEHAGCVCACKIADGRNLSVTHADIGRADAVVVDASSTLEEKIEVHAGRLRIEWRLDGRHLALNVRLAPEPP
jgi:hypothetical protein